MEAVVAYTLAQPGNERVQSVNALVGETNDGGLNDIRGQHVTRDHVACGHRGGARAVRSRKAASVPAPERGAFGWKGGIGTASRVLPGRYGGYTLGVLVQTNFGGVLTMAGVPVGQELGRDGICPLAWIRDPDAGADSPTRTAPA